MARISKMRSMAFTFTMCLLATANISAGADNAKQTDKWTVGKPKRVTSLVAEEKGEVQPDGSVRFVGDVPWSEATLEFRFPRAMKIHRLRVEILPRSKKDKRLERGAAPLWLFDIKPFLRRGKRTVTLDWKSCVCPRIPDDDDVPNCIDFLTDSGWRVPKLVKSQESQELVMRLDKTLQLEPGEVFELAFDSGGGPDFGVLARVRVSFESADPPAKTR